MSTVVLPSSKDLKDMLTGLVGKPVGVLPGDPVTPTPDDPVAVGVFVDPYQNVNALCVMDLAASVYTAGALALLPPGGCQDSVEEDREISAMQFEALHEVMNVLSAMFNVSGAPHSKLDGVFYGDNIPGDVAGMLSAFNRIDLLIDIPGYGKGHVSLIIP